MGRAFIQTKKPKVLSKKKLRVTISKKLNRRTALTWKFLRGKSRKSLSKKKLILNANKSITLVKKKIHVGNNSDVVCINRGVKGTQLHSDIDMERFLKDLTVSLMLI